MHKKKLFIEVLGLAILIAILHSAALKYSLYWTIDWFDILMHFLGGLWISIFALYLVFVLKIVHIPREHYIMVVIVAMGSVLVAGLAWELWELLSGLTFVFKDKADTLLDIVMDIIGGGAGLWYGTKVLCRKK